MWQNLIARERWAVPVFYHEQNLRQLTLESNTIWSSRVSISNRISVCSTVVAHRSCVTSRQTERYLRHLRKMVHRQIRKQAQFFSFVEFFCNLWVHVYFYNFPNFAGIIKYRSVLFLLLELRLSCRCCFCVV